MLAGSLPGRAFSAWTFAPSGARSYPNLAI